MAFKTGCKPRNVEYLVQIQAILHPHRVLDTGGGQMVGSFYLVTCGCHS